MLSSPTPRATRRRALGTMLALPLSGAGLAGCDLLPGRGSPDPTPPSPGGRGRPGDDEEPNDASLLDEAVALTLAGLALVGATGQRHPGLAGALEPLEEMHTAHLAVLTRSLADDPDPAPAPPVPARPPAAIRRVHGREEEGRGRLATLAGRARSGEFARLLASMAAATGQHLVPLPRPRDVDTPA